MVCNTTIQKGENYDIDIKIIGFVTYIDVVLTTTYTIMKMKKSIRLAITMLLVLFLYFFGSFETSLPLEVGYILEMKTKSCIRTLIVRPAWDTMCILKCNI